MKSRSGNFVCQPCIPAILAIKIRNVMKLARQKDDFDNLRTAIESDNEGQLKKWNLVYPHIIENISSNLLGFKPNEFNEVLMCLIEDIVMILETLQSWHCTAPYYLRMNVQELLLPRHYETKDEDCEPKWLRIYGVYFDRLRDGNNETNYPWWSNPIKYGKISFVPEN